MSLITHLRVEIGDVAASGSSPRYEDSYLVSVLEKSARRINRELYLTSGSSEISISSLGVIAPADEDLSDLVLLQAECIILNIDMNNDFNSSGDGAGGGYFVKDGEQSFDTRGEASSRASARTKYMDNRYNPCAELDRALTREKLMRSCDMRDIW